MSSIQKKATALYQTFGRSANFLQSPLLLAVRLYWGWQFFQTGWGKLQDIAKVTDFFTSLGLPFPNVTAYVVGTSECIGGILLFLGLGSRLISLPLLADMVGAYLTADREALRAIFSEPGKFYAADPYTFLFASLLILVFGPGKISVDALIERLIRRETRVFVSPSSAVAIAGR
ncbi:MAG TPA: DoxX family protein [Terriglobales bacterium]|nr:DoxX family protein [Terriglobales bacterium]